jgi:kynurenine formamidase
MNDRALPTKEDVLAYADTCSNWGRWGPDDQLGTVNLVTPEKRKQAAGLVRDGVSVSCAWPIQKSMPGEPMSKFIHYMTDTGEALNPGEKGSHGWSGDFFGIEYHGYSVTHVDAICHVFRDGQTYNGHSAKLVNVADGAEVESVELLEDGVVTRGVLLDIARLRGVKWLEGAAAILPEDLEAAEEAQGVRVEPGDILMVRTGHLGRHYGDGPLDLTLPHPGTHAACIPWFRERDIAMLGSDTNNDMNPSGYEGLDEAVHQIGIPTLGIWLIDNMNLEQVAEACAERNRWEFMLNIAPLRIKAGTGSPINPIAVF